MNFKQFQSRSKVNSLTCVGVDSIAETVTVAQFPESVSEVSFIQA